MAKTAIASTDQPRSSGSTPSAWARFTKYLEDVRTEMRMVSSPSFKDVKATTAVVVVTVFLFAAYFYGIDKVIGYFVDHILQWAKTA